jgi:hypothetical protein
MWVIAHSQVISVDGITYIRMARELSGGVARIAGVARQYDYHIGYPLAVAAMHGVASRLGLPPGVDGWDLSGKAVSLIASVLAMAAVWVFAERTFNWQTALLTTVLLGVMRKWAVLGEDVLSDAPAVALQLWGIVFALWTLESLARPGRRTMVMAGLTGLCAGLGYLVRPEAMLPAGLAAALWLAWQFRGKLQWKWTLASLLAMTLTVIGCALPYLLIIGTFTKKKRMADIVGLLAGHGLPLATTGQFSPRIISAAGILAWRLGEAMGFILWGLTIVWLLGWIAKRIMGREVLPLRRHEPAAPGAFLMIVGTTILTPILIGLELHVHYLDYRHATFLAILLSPLGGAEAWALLGAIDSAFFSSPAAVRFGLKIAAIVSGLAPSMYFSLQPIHPDKVYELTAARKLIPLLAADDYVLTDSPRLLHYIAAPGEEVPSDETVVLQRVGAGRPVVTWVAVHDETGAGLHPPVFFEVIRETDRTGSTPHTLRVFRVVRDAVP